MRVAVLVVSLLLVPMASAFITYVIVSALNQPVVLDSTQAAIICLVMMNMVFLGGTRVFPIDLNNFFDKLTNVGDRERRDITPFYSVPDVDTMPCIRRILCEMESTIRYSDGYGEQQVSGNTVDRHPEEEVSPDEPDPISEMQVEAVRAMYGLHRPDSPDCTPETRKALAAMECLTGSSCERAYRLCPGRITAPMTFRIIFEEAGIKLKSKTNKRIYK